MALVSSCAFAPVNGHYETSETLGKNNVEVSANYTRYNAVGADVGESLINHNVGVRLGVGLSDRADLKIRYERLMPPASFDEFLSSESPIDFFSIAPKWSSLSERWAFKTPLGFYFLGDETMMTVGFSAFRTKTVSNNVSLTLGLHNQNIIAMDGGDAAMFPMLGASFGMAFGPADKWQIRPELGLLSDPFFGSLNFNYGAALVLQLGSN